MPVTTSLEARWSRLRRRIGELARADGRSGDDVLLVAVTKSVDPARAAELRRLGQADLGESRADDLERKVLHFRTEGLAARWHFVGHLQRNKARRVVRVADVIHSVDSLELLAAIARVAREEGRRPEVYLQVKLAPEAAKTGLDPARLREVALGARAHPEVLLVGLMTIAPLGDPADPLPRAELARAAFAELARLARGLAADPATRAAFRDGRVRTSMGMSDDYALAIAAGSDVVRVGSALFASGEEAGG